MIREQKLGWLIGGALLVAALLVVFSGKTRADGCQTRVEISATIKAHAATVGVRDLTADETNRAIVAVIEGDTPAPDTVAEGLFALRADGAGALWVWLKDGTCGSAMLSPDAAMNLVKAVVGTDA